MAGQGGAQMNNREKTATTLVHSVNAQFLFIPVISEDVYKRQNQINGISPTNVNKQVYIEAARGAAGFMWNEISNEIMCWAEGG